LTSNGTVQVFLTKEESKEKFEDYFSEMPWAAVPFGSPSVSKLYARFCKTDMQM
jgi:hypothetical protein